jgi:choline dehydrogenase-like flavoprotein
MDQLSRPFNSLVELLKQDPEPYDVVVVGSGYGGAVAALRLADAGLRTCVLERGREYGPGQFPTGIADAPAYFKVDRGDWDVSGYDDALFDVHVGDETVVVAGSALGGGSQINASVAMAPDQRVFEQPRWPAAIRDHAAEFLSTFDKVLTELRAVPFDGIRNGNDCVTPVKTTQFRRAAHACAHVEPAHVTISLSACTSPSIQGACVGCGDCVSGCNFGAKVTLTSSYLANAFKAGADMYTGVCVSRLGRGASSWEVRFVKTTDEKELRQLRREVHALVGGRTPKGRRERLKALTARLEELTHTIPVAAVVLAAGTIGSTQILLRSREGVHCSDELGKRFSGNGDYLAFSYWQDEPVNAVGGTMNRAAPTGPTITQVARFHDADLAKSFVVEDAAIPGTLAALFQELVTDSSALHQLNARDFKDGTPRGSRDPIGSSKEARDHTQVYLAMGHDRSGGDIRLTDYWRAQVAWPTLGDDSPFELYDKKLGATSLGGVYLGNPVWRPIPQATEGMLSGARFRGRDLIVHPLGGCAMADSIAKGVVDDVGRVYDKEKPHGVHDGLYVLDGSIVPTSLGANPFLTITALAERAMTVIAPYEAARKTARPPRKQPPREFPVRNASPVPAFNRNPVGFEFSEVLVGELRDERTDDWRIAARLEVHLPVEDMSSLLDERRHCFHQAKAMLQLTQQTRESIPLTTVTYAPAVGTVTIMEYSRETWLRHAVQTVQVMLTWLVERGCNEIKEKLVRSIASRFAAPRTGQAPETSLRSVIADGLRLAWHAADVRRMEYRFDIVAQRPPEGYFPQTLRLAGEKRIAYAADWGALLRYAWQRVRGKAAWLERPNLWLSMTELKVSLHSVMDGRPWPIAHGHLKLAPVETFQEHPPKLFGETSAGLLQIFAYPLLFARYLLKCRLWDFRLPDYTPPAEFKYPRADDSAARKVYSRQRLPILSINGKTVEPEAYAFEVPRSDNDTTPIELVLWRYRHEVRPGPTRDGFLQCNSVMLLHAFGQSAISFAEPTLAKNLVQYLHEGGWDVWLLEHRISIGLPASHTRCTMDDIAFVDIPAACRLCIATLRAELRRAGQVTDQSPELQIYALGQCVGSGALGMSILGGALAHKSAFVPAPDRNRFGKYYPPQASMLAGVVFSQFTPYVIGRAGSQFRAFLPTLLRDVFGLDEVQFAAPSGSAPTSQTDTLVDRLLATWPTPPSERCPGERQGAGRTQVHATCRRMAGIEAPLFMHANLSTATHDRLPDLLANANIDIFVHARKCIENERLVDANGLNVYVNQQALQSHLHMPVAFLHGRENELFAVGSSRRSHATMRRVFGREHMRSRVRLIVLPGYGHLDWLIGKDAHSQAKTTYEKNGRTYAKTGTYHKVTDFLNEAWRTNRDTKATELAPKAEQQRDADPGAELRLPDGGPLIGWTRTSNGERLLRLWVKPHRNSAAPADFVVCSYRYGPKGSKRRVLKVFLVRDEEVDLVRDLAVVSGGDQKVDSGPDQNFEPKSQGRSNPADLSTPDRLKIAYAAFDLAIPSDHFDGDRPLAVEVYTLHPLTISTSPGWAGPEPAAMPMLPATEIVPVYRVDPGNEDANACHREDCRREWEELLTKKDFAKFEELRKELKDDVRKWKSMAQRTVRTVISRTSLRRRDRTDGRAYIRRSWFEPGDGSIRMLATCCRYPGFMIERDRVDDTFRRMCRLPPLTLEAGKRAPVPAAMVLAGDQIYADYTAGLFDVTTPIEKFGTRYRDLFDAVGFRKAVRRFPTYMAIDDHEIADSWDTSQSVVDPVLAQIGLAHAGVHQWSHSEGASLTGGVVPRNGGFVHRFDLHGYVPVIVLDTRSTRDRTVPRIMDQTAWTAFENWLGALRNDDRPKVVVTGNPIAPGLRRYVDEDGNFDRDRAKDADTWQAFEQDRARLLQLIADTSLGGFVLLSGDYHPGVVATVRNGHRRIATAVVAPAAYAPLAYANERARDIPPVERFAGWSIELANFTDDEPAAVDGSGYADIVFEPLDDRWQMTVTFRLRAIAAGSNELFDRTCQVSLG